MANGRAKNIGLLGKSPRVSESLRRKLKKKEKKKSLILTLAAAAAKLLQSCPTLCDPIDGSHQSPLSLGFSRQEYWSGLPFP